MADLIVYGGPAIFCLLLAYLVHHMHGTHQLIERTRIEEREDMQKLNELMQATRDQMAPGTKSRMCPRCSVGSFTPPRTMCDACHETLPRLKPAEPTEHTLGGPTTPTGVRV